MPYNYRWAQGENKARDLAAKVSRCDGWSQIENTAKCGNVTCKRYELQVGDEEDYHAYWLCYQHTSIYPADPKKWDTTPGFCCDKDFPQLPIARLKNGHEIIYR